MAAPNPILHLSLEQGAGMCVKSGFVLIYSFNCNKVQEYYGVGEPKKKYYADY